MRALFFRWTSPYTRPPRWMGFVYYSTPRNAELWVIFPFSLLVALAWLIQDIWAAKACAPSWVEMEIRRRLEDNRRHSTHWQQTLSRKP